MERAKGLKKLPCREACGLLGHESYKLLVMNRAGLILLLFLALLGYRNLSRGYRLTPSESYYRSMLLQLEGALTDEKEALIEGERQRYEEAFAKLEEIDEKIGSGELTEETGEAMKTPYYNEVAYYSTFLRVEQQYAHVKETQGVFVYDTGYSYLLGYRDNHFKEQLLLLLAGVLFAFCNAYPMERQNASWGMLIATARGKRSIAANKALLCAAWTLVFFAANLFFYVFAIAKVYPFSQPGARVSDLPVYYGTGLSVPIWLGLALLVFLSAAALVAAVQLLLWESARAKTQLQALFAGAVTLLLPVWIFFP